MAAASNHGAKTLFPGWPEPVRTMVIGAGLAGTYYLCGRFALLLAIPPGYATAIWPAAGIALAGVLLFGNRFWPGIWLGSFLINVWTSLDTHSLSAIAKSVALAGSLGLGASLQALAGAWVMRRWIGFPCPLTQQNEVLKFLALAPASCLVSATFGVGSLWLGNVIQGSNVFFSWWTWWVGDSIGVLIFTPLILIWSVRSPGTWPRRPICVCLPLMVTFAAVLLLFLYASSWEQNRVRQEFERRTDELARRFVQSFEHSRDVLHSIAGFYAASPELNRTQFHAFLEPYLARHSAIQALSWNVRVPGPQREDYEAAARKDGFPSFEFTEPRGDQLTTAGVRDEYFPVYFLEPFAANEAALGFDTASEPVRRSSMEQACDSGQAVATSGVTLAQDRETGQGLLVVLPVYRPGLPHETVADRRQNLVAFAAAVFRIPRLMISSTRGLHLHNLELRLWDQPDHGSDRLLYGPSEAAAARSKSASIQTERVLDVAGRRWKLQLTAPPEYLVAHRSWAAWSMLLAGLLFTAVLGALLQVLTGRTAAIQELVDRRTLELQRANEDLRHQITERNRAEDQIKASLKEKEVMLREIHHRVRNNLQVVSSMLYLQGQMIQEPQARRWLQDSQYRIKAMALAHQQLDQSSNLAQIDLADYLRKLMGHLFRSLAPDQAAIEWQLHGSQVLVGIDAAIGCGLIVQELASNSLKHAFPGGRVGKMVIDLIPNDDHSLALKFWDDGVGLPKEVNSLQTQSLGLQFVRLLSRQLNATMECRNGCGTRFSFTFTETPAHGTHD